MNKKIKKIIILLIITIIFIILFNIISFLLMDKWNGYGTDVLNFYKQDKNTIDILVLGSSHAYCSFNPYLIEEKTGFKAYNFCTQEQPIWITYHYLKEALKTQKPKYIFLDVHTVVALKSKYHIESVNRDALDRIKMSINKIEAINVSVETLEERMSYYFNIVKYHPRFKELNKNDFEVTFLGKTVDNKGHIALDAGDTKINIIKHENIDETINPPEKNIKYLEKIIQLAKENNIQLIFIKAPAIYSEERYKSLNYIKKIANKNEIKFFDYIRDIDKLNLDFQEDFFNAGHLSKTGSEKFTIHFLKELNLIQEK